MKPDLCQCGARCRCGDMLVHKVDTCEVHPDVRLRTPNERMDFERKFDERLAASKIK